MTSALKRFSDRARSGFLQLRPAAGFRGVAKSGISQLYPFLIESVMKFIAVGFFFVPRQAVIHDLTDRPALRRMHEITSQSARRPSVAIVCLQLQTDWGLEETPVLGP